MKNAAYILTAYEHVGTVSRDEYIEMYIDEELEVTIDMIDEYNEYLSDNGDETYYSMDDLEDVLSCMTAVDAFNLGYFSGNFNMADDCFTFDGYGHLSSLSNFGMIREMADNKDFLRWYVENYEDIDEEEIKAIVEEANRLIAAGY